jgi:hypothetical protein
MVRLLKDSVVHPMRVQKLSSDWVSFEPYAGTASLLLSRVTPNSLPVFSLSSECVAILTSDALTQQSGSTKRYKESKEVSAKSYARCTMQMGLRSIYHVQVAVRKRDKSPPLAIPSTTVIYPTLPFLWRKAARSQIPRKSLTITHAVCRSTLLS